MTVIGRDPFAREDYIRQIISKDDKWQRGCSWCGSMRKNRSLFCYGTSPDSYRNRENWDDRLFCSIGCRRNYYD